MEEFFELRRIEFDDKDTSLEKPRLKPCPFCGEQAELDGDGVMPDQLFYQVHCDCGTSGPRFYQHRHLAVQGWNKMARRE